MKLITNLISSFLMVSIVESLFVPTELPSPVIPAAAPTVNFSNGSLVDNIGSFSSQVSNAMCEANPTHLLCGTSVATGHKIVSHHIGSLLIIDLYTYIYVFLDNLD